MTRWQLLSQLPSIAVVVAVGLWVFDVPPGETLWMAVFVGLVFLYATAPVWGEPVRNWGRMRTHLEMGGPWCRHQRWTDWMPDEDGTHGHHAWCCGCGWVMRIDSSGYVPWRYRAGLPQLCGPEVDPAWTLPAPKSDEEDEGG